VEAAVRPDYYNYKRGLGLIFGGYTAENQLQPSFILQDLCGGSGGAEPAGLAPLPLSPQV
jgi:hypothetical protein